MENNILKCPIFYNSTTGDLSGEEIVQSKRTLGEIKSIFKDSDKVTENDENKVAYKVLAHFPVEENTSGGLFFGTSILSPGKVGDEYIMTKGHFHSKKDTGEYYWCISGEGMLILMDEDNKCWAIEMKKGAIHYIPGKVAHRLANTGNEEFVVGACWPSDAGHDYDTIVKTGFSKRLIDVNGTPTLV